MTLGIQDVERARDTRGPSKWKLYVAAAGDIPSPGVPSWVMVDGAGTLVIVNGDGTGDTLTLAAGVMYPIHPIQITGGTATGIHLGYGTNPTG
jgi:hypothetical protein